MNIIKDGKDVLSSSLSILLFLYSRIKLIMNLVCIHLKLLSILTCTNIYTSSFSNICISTHQILQKNKQKQGNILCNLIIQTKTYFGELLLYIADLWTTKVWMTRVHLHMFLFFSINARTVFHPLLESTNAKDWLYALIHTILYRGLEHHKMWYLKGVLEPIPCGY